MRFFASIFILLSLSIATASAYGDASPSPSPSASPIGVVVHSLPQVQMVAVAEPAAPPSWAQDLMISAQKLPVIGPVVSKALLYLGILSSILTLLAGFLLGAIKVLSGVFNYAGLGALAQSISDFENGPFMYYLKYFSLFNANKSDPQ